MVGGVSLVWIPAAGEQDNWLLMGNQGCGPSQAHGR